MEATKWIKLWTITRAKNDMKWWSWIEKNWKRYYTFYQAIQTAKEQWLTLPTKQDFLDSWFTEERSKDNKKLADKLWFTLDGWCDSDGALVNEGEYGYVRSSSERNSGFARYFNFGEGKGGLSRDSRSSALAVRPVLKNSTSDNSSIWLFEKLVERAEANGAKLWAKAGYTLWKILLDNK